MLVHALKQELVPRLDVACVSQHYGLVLRSMDQRGVDGIKAFIATYESELHLTAPPKVLQVVWSQAACHRRWFAAAQRLAVAGGIAVPACGYDDGPSYSEPYAELLRLLSWTYCPKCGLRLADGRPGQRSVCKNGHRCDLSPDLLELDLSKDDARPRGDVQYYTSPNACHWPRYREVDGQYYMLIENASAEEQAQESVLELSAPEAESLAPVRINCEVGIARGGAAATVNMQKKSVIRAEYKAEPVVQSLGTARARAAYHWLMASNPTYASYTQEHLRVLAARQLSPDTPLYIGTSQLLLFSPGIEVAARPVLYARSAFGDSDHRARRLPLRRMDVRGCPSTRVSYRNKLFSRVLGDGVACKLACLLYDIALGRELMALAALADSKNVSPEALCTHKNSYESYWFSQQEIIFDRCRIRGKPRLFLTIAPAAWKFPMHEHLFKPWASNKKLRDVQALLTIHLYNSLVESVQKRLTPIDVCGSVRRLYPH